MTNSLKMTLIEKIPLQEIDLADDTFSVNFMPDLERLRFSIEEVGLIQPTLLRKRPGKHQIVCGFRRIAVLREKGSPAVEGSVVEEDDEFRLFCLSLHDNLTTRGLNAVEKAIALDKLIYRFRIDRSAVITKFLPLFSLETNEKILDTFLSLARMEDEVKRYGENVFRIPVGHTFLVQETKKHNAVFGVEKSGHICVPKFFWFDDAIINSMYMIEIVSKIKYLRLCNFSLEEILNITMNYF